MQTPAHHRALFALFFAALVLAGALGLAACSPGNTVTDEFRIGLLGPISNNPARFGAHLLAEARVAKINSQGGLEVGGRKLKVRLIVADTAGQTERTMSAMSRLIQQERVSAIIGPYYSREAIPVAAAMESLHVPLLTPSATSPELTRGRTFVFRVCQVDSEQGAALARYAYEDLGLRRAAVLFDESDAYSSGLAGFFQKAFAAYPGAVAHREGYSSGTQDFQAQLARIRAAGAQVLLLPNFPADLSRQLPQARSSGFAGLFLGGDSWDTDMGFHSLPEAQGAVYSTEFFPATADARLLGAAQTLAAQSGVELVKNAALTLDALDLLFAAAKNVGSTDPVSLRSGLAALRGFEGLTGSISFTDGGDPDRSVNILSISGGAEVLRLRLGPARQ